MERSVDRVLTTHAGSLPRPEQLREAWSRQTNEEGVLQTLLQESVGNGVAAQEKVESTFQTRASSAIGHTLGFPGRPPAKRSSVAISTHKRIWISDPLLRALTSVLTRRKQPTSEWVILWLTNARRLGSFNPVNRAPTTRTSPSRVGNAFGVGP